MQGGGLCNKDTRRTCFASRMVALCKGKGKKKGFFSKLGGVGQSAKEQKVLGDTSTNYSSQTGIKKYCAECGNQIDADAKFCSSCGAKQ